MPTDDELDANYAPIYGWVRFALTGSATSPDPTADELRFLVTDQIAAVQGQHPEIKNLTDPNDIAAFQKAIGYFVVAEYAQSPAGQQFVGAIIKTDIDAVSETRGAISVSDAVTFALLRANEALLRIGVLKTVAPGTNLYGVTQKRERIYDGGCGGYGVGGRFGLYGRGGRRPIGGL